MHVRLLQVGSYWSRSSSTIRSHDSRKENPAPGVSSKVPESKIYSDSVFVFLLCRFSGLLHHYYSDSHVEKINDAGAVTIASCVAGLSELETLKYWIMRDGDGEYWESMAQVLIIEMFCFLSPLLLPYVFSLSGNNIADDGITQLCASLHNHPRFSYLQFVFYAFHVVDVGHTFILSLASNKFGSAGVDAIGRMVSTIPHFHTLV